MGVFRERTLTFVCTRSLTSMSHVIFRVQRKFTDIPSAMQTEEGRAGFPTSPSTLPCPSERDLGAAMGRSLVSMVGSPGVALQAKFRRQIRCRSTSLLTSTAFRLRRGRGITRPPLGMPHGFDPAARRITLIYLAGLITLWSG